IGSLPATARLFPYTTLFRSPTLITNCSNNYGPYHFPEKLIPLMILNALARRPLPVYGDGKQVRDWLYVEDHARALIQAATEGRRSEEHTSELQSRENLVCRL